MSRSAFSSTAQIEKLLVCLEERRYLATGYARTSHVRDRTRAACQDEALKLISEGSQTLQQCAKPSASAVDPSYQITINFPTQTEDSIILYIQDDAESDLILFVISVKK